MQRTAYLALGKDAKQEDALKEQLVILRDAPPDTPYLKVKITVTSYEPRYKHERGISRAEALARKNAA